MNTVSKQDIRDARLGSEDQTLLSSIDEILDDMKLGKPVIIVDDEDRENEGDLVGKGIPYDQPNSSPGLLHRRRQQLRPAQCISDGKEGGLRTEPRRPLRPAQQHLWHVCV